MAVFMDLVGVAVHIEFCCCDGPMRIFDIVIRAVDYRMGRVLHIIDYKVDFVFAVFRSFADKSGVGVLIIIECVSISHIRVNIGVIVGEDIANVVLDAIKSQWASYSKR